jgi:hypothetical protein
MVGRPWNRFKLSPLLGLCHYETPDISVDSHPKALLLSVLRHGLHSTPTHPDYLSGASCNIDNYIHLR